MTPGAYIRAARRALGLTLHNVWELTGITVGLLSDIERGKKRLPVTVAEALRDAVGLDAAHALALDGRLTARAVAYLQAHPEAGVALDAAARDGGG